MRLQSLAMLPTIPTGRYPEHHKLWEQQPTLAENTMCPNCSPQAGPTSTNCAPAGLMPGSTLAGSLTSDYDSPVIEINSVRDHTHILFAQSKNHAPAKIVEQVKTASSGWIKTLDPWYSDFAWQTGYGEFSVSPMHVESVRDYVRNQAEQHRQEDFQTEYRRFCEKNGKPLDERYAWD